MERSFVYKVEEQRYYALSIVLKLLKSLIILKKIKDVKLEVPSV